MFIKFFIDLGFRMLGYDTT